MEAIGQLTGGVAHDFNNLLTVIIGSLELLRRRMPDDAKLRSLVDNAESAAQRGASLTKRMLAFARKQELDRTAVDLPVLVHGMSELLQRTLGPSIRIESRFPLDLPKVHTDANQLESALLNLVVNARDAMPAGGPIIISAEETTVASRTEGLRPGPYVRFAVEDRGEGMDEVTLAKAAEPFFTTKGVGKGTGLGLSMVHGFAEQAGGRLTLASKKGVGTTVTLWLPVAEKEAIAAAPATPDAAGAQCPSLLRILAVDDDYLVLLNTELMLEDLGHKVITAGSGREALQKLKEGAEVDVVLTDHAMPEMNGLQLSDAVRREWPSTTVILATGYAELPDNLQSALPRLSKPFNQDDLARVLAETHCGKAA
jgi:CheY-like chemotaxis protein